MLKKADCVFFITLALLALAAISLWTFLHGPEPGDTPLARWERGGLTVSERAYLADRFERIVQTWQQMGIDAPNDVCLAVDTTQRSIRVERKGRPLENCVVDLPDWMTWMVHRTDAGGMRQLGGPVRFTRRTAQAKQPLPERIWVVGESTSGQILTLHFDSNSSGSRYGIRPFNRSWNISALQDGVDYCESMVVSNAEYRTLQSSWAEDDVGKAPNLEPIESNVNECRDAWSRAERRIYRSIEGQIIRADLALHQLRVAPGPDYSAGHAELTVFRRGLLQDVLHPHSVPSIHLKIDHLGDGVWYIRNADDPPRRLFGTMRQESLRLEFLVLAGEPVKPKDRSAWIEKGRRIPEGPIVPSAKWRAELTNGVIVEFIGIREYPSENGQWWGPDGSLLGYVPCLNARPLGRRVGDRKIVEIAWRMQRPNDARNMSTQFSFEGGFPSYSGQPCDRYGIRLIDVYCHSHAFEKSQTKTTLTLGADVDGKGLRRVKFKNVSLLPGKDFGYEIEVLK